MAEALIQILIAIFSVLLLGGIVWTFFCRNPRKLSPSCLAAIDGISEASTVKRLSVRPFLFRLERFFVSGESLWFDRNFIYVFDGQKLAAKYKFEQILELEVTKIRINHARIWRIRFVDGASGLERSSANKSEQDGAQNFANDEFVNSVQISPSNFKILRKHIGANEIKTDANKSDENAASEYKFVPAASIFTPNFKEFLQILREKNQGAIKTEPRFWETV